jgi:small-conductance mechanosensitive channel
VNIDVGVRYGTDPERVLDILRAAGTAHPRVLSSPEPVALFQEFGASSLDFQLRVWVGAFDEWFAVASDLRVAVNAALAEAGIEIPYPQRDLHLRSVDPEARAAWVPSPTGSPGSGRTEA